MYQTTKIPELIDPQATYTSNGQEAWRVLGIMAEFAAATERLRGVRPAVSMFGSARIKHDHPYYAKAERIARLLSDAGFAVISGGGPGTDGSRESRRVRRQVAGDRPQHPAAARERRQRVPGRRIRFPLLLRAQDDVRALRLRVRRAAGRIRHARRAVRVPDARADRQEPAHPDHPGRRRFLARARRLDARQAGRRGHGRTRRTSG